MNRSNPVLYSLRWTGIRMRAIRMGIISFCLLLCCGAVSGQSGKGTVLIAVKPSDAVIRLDTALFIQKKQHVLLDTGTYMVRAWAPRCQLVTDTLVVTSGRPMVYRLELPYTEEYKSYRRELRSYHRKMALTRYIPWALTLGVAIYFPYRYASEKDAADNYYEEAVRYREMYESLTDEELIAEYKSGYEQARAKYDEAIDNSNDAAVASMIAIPAAVAVSTGLYFLSRRFEKPVFTETPLLSDLSFSITPPVHGRTTMATFIAKF